MSQPKKLYDLVGGPYHGERVEIEVGRDFKTMPPVPRIPCYVDETIPLYEATEKMHVYKAHEYMHDNGFIEVKYRYFEGANDDARD